MMDMPCEVRQNHAVSVALLTSDANTKDSHIREIVGLHVAIRTGLSVVP